MTAAIIDGKARAAALRTVLRDKIKATGIIPGLAFILAGDDAASHVYVAGKEKACAEVGIHSQVYRFPHQVTQAEIIATIEALNSNPLIHGILIQLPLPSHLDTDVILSHVSPDKDVDGLHPLNLGKLLAGKPGMVPCTPQGIMLLLQDVIGNFAGLHAVVVGRSILVGKPLGQLLLQAHCTVTHCHSRTLQLSDYCRQADILVAAVGSPKLIQGDWVKPGAVVIDVGINRTDNGLVGDVDFSAASTRARAITPVPGGVGPMTIACLLQNTLRAARVV